MNANINLDMSKYSDYTRNMVLKNQDRFVDPSKNPSWTDWLFSMGTNLTCYAEAMENMNDDAKFNKDINVIRIILYAITKPLKSEFFYWTLLLLILHKFNFKKPVMKIILAHYILRAIGDIFEQIGTGLMTSYYYVTGTTGEDGVTTYSCAEGVSAEKHPLRWFLTRQIGLIFWYTGEICGDWYPLLRTRAVAREQTSMYYVYAACGLFNLSKIVMIINHYTFPVKKLYKEDGTFNVKLNDDFYGRFWIIEAIIIITSLIYDMTVYFVLKKQIFNRTKSDFGFLKKFRSISEYRIIVSVVICVFLLPAVLVAVGFKIYYMYHEGRPGLDFSFEELRLIIINVQYYMIFIDQIMLFRSRGDTSLGESQSTTPYNTNNNISGNNISGNNFSTNNLSSNTSNQYVKPATIDSKLYYTNLNNYSNINNSNLNSYSNLNSLGSINNQSNLIQYSYANTSNNNNMNYVRMKARNNNNTLTSYDEYSPSTNEWTYLRNK